MSFGLLGQTREARANLDTALPIEPSGVRRSTSIYFFAGMELKYHIFKDGSLVSPTMATEMKTA
jgi:hypothetical protein